MDNFEQWVADIEQDTDFISRATKLKNTYKKGLTSKKDKDVFEDIFEYFREKYEMNIPFDLQSLYIYMTDVKGWPDFDYKVYMRLLTLIGLCGFSWK